MKEYKFRYSDLVMNTLIEVNKKENRRVIDFEDIKNYKELIKNEALKKGAVLVFEPYTGKEECVKKLEEETNDYILITYKESNNIDYIVLYPWISEEEIKEEFRDDFPHSIWNIFNDITSNPKIQLPKRSSKPTKKLGTIQYEINNKYLEIYQIKVEEAELQLDDAQKKLTKIKNVINKK